MTPSPRPSRTRRPRPRLPGDRPPRAALGVGEAVVAALDVDHPRPRPAVPGRLRADRRAPYKSSIGSGQPIDDDFADATAVSLSLFGTNFAQLALGVLGVLVTAGEYSTGMIRSTLAAVPRRLPVLWSKAAVFGLVALVVGVAGRVRRLPDRQRHRLRHARGHELLARGVVRSLLGAGALPGPGRRDRRRAGRAAALGGRRDLGAGRRAHAGPGADLAAAELVAGRHQPLPAEQRGRVDVRPDPRRQPCRRAPGCWSCSAGRRSPWAAPPTGSCAADA